MTPRSDASRYAPSLVRMGLSIVFLWFGLHQLFVPDAFVGWLPPFLLSLPIPPSTFLALNGSFETLFGIFLLLGLFTRLTALLLTFHLIGILIFSVGYNEIGVRDFGLMMATLSVFLSGPDLLCLDGALQRFPLIRFLSRLSFKEKV